MCICVGTAGAERGYILTAGFGMGTVTHTVCAVGYGVRVAEKVVVSSPDTGIYIHTRISSFPELLRG